MTEASTGIFLLLHDNVGKRRSATTIMLNQKTLKGVTGNEILCVL